MAAVRITIEDLTQKVNDGWKKDQLAEHYDLPKAQVTKLLREAGLQIRKFHKPKYELVRESEQEEVVDINVQAEEVASVQENVEETSTPEETVNEEVTTTPQGW